MIAIIYLKKRNTMSILKFALLGAAVAYGITQLTKKREDGTTILDDLTEKAPEWMDKAKGFKSEMQTKYDNLKGDYTGL